MYWVAPSGRLRQEIEKVLVASGLFEHNNLGTADLTKAEKVILHGWSDGNLYVYVPADKPEFPVIEDRLPVDAEEDVCGGGRVESCNGKLFKITCEEIKKLPWLK